MLLFKIWPSLSLVYAVFGVWVVTFISLSGLGIMFSEGIDDGYEAAGNSKPKTVEIQYWFDYVVKIIGYFLRL